MSRRPRHKRLVLEEFDWEHVVLAHCWHRTARDELNPERLAELDHEVFETLHPVLKTSAAEHGIELTGFGASRM